MGGNNPKYINSIIGIFLPDVVKEQYKSFQFAYHYAGWHSLVVGDILMEDKYRAEGPHRAFVNWDQARMRACEYLNYEGYNKLMEHSDGYATSVVLNVLLSKEQEYEGCDFYMKDRVQGNMHTVLPG